MRTNPRSRHGKSGRECWLQILEEREEADRTRALVELGLPADFDIDAYTLQLGASFYIDDEDLNEDCLPEADDRDFDSNGDDADDFDDFE